MPKVRYVRGNERLLLTEAIKMERHEALDSAHADLSPEPEPVTYPIVAESRMGIEIVPAVVSQQVSQIEDLAAVEANSPVVITLWEIASALRDGSREVTVRLPWWMPARLFRRLFIVLRWLPAVLLFVASLLKLFSPELIAIVGLMRHGNVEFCQRASILQNCVKIMMRDPQ